MITFINTELFTVNTELVSNDKGELFMTDVLTVPAASKKNVELKQRVFTKITSLEEDYNASKVAVHASVGPKGSEKISIRASERNKYDSDLVMVAIPFNGIAQPIEPSFNYRIHKGMVVTSDKRNIEFNGNTYKKVLYLLIEPNNALFDPNHKYHVDEISLDFVTYNLETQTDESTTTIKSSTTVRFTENEVEFLVASEEVEPVTTDAFRGNKLFTPYQHNAKKATDRKNTRNNNFANRPNRNNGYFANKKNFHQNRGNRNA